VIAVQANIPPHENDFIWLTSKPQVGREQSGRRCAIVLSPRSCNSKTGLCLVCPTTNQDKGYPFEVPLPQGFGVSGVVLSDHVKNLDWAGRQSEFICKGTPEIIAEVRAKIKALAGI
jgi:mRNA interferase MazF